MTDARKRFSGIGAAAAALLPLLALSASAQSSKNDTLPISDYRALIRAYRQNAQKPTASAEAIQDRLRAVRVVTLPDGSRVSVNNRAEADRLSRRIKPGEMGKRERLTLETRSAALDRLVGAQQAAVRGTGDAKAAAASILSTPEFQNALKPKREDSWFDKAKKSLFNSIERLLSRIFAWFRPKGSVDPALLGNLAQFVQYVLFFALAIGAIVGVYFLARLIVQRNPQWRSGKNKNGDNALDLSETEMHDPLSAARGLADSGDYRGAVRLVYIASLRRLAGAGLLVMARDRTNWEYQRAVRSRSQSAYATLLPATRSFDRIWYGRMPATRDEYEAAVAVHEALPATPDPAGTTS